VRAKTAGNGDKPFEEQGESLCGSTWRENTADARTDSNMINGTPPAL
jgi:hypothetical protein